jgi:hypothetical protein
MTSIQSLPSERLYQILLHLKWDDLIAFCRTNRTHAEIYRDQYFWRLKYRHDYGLTEFVTLQLEFPELTVGNWRRAYYCRTLTRYYREIYVGYYQDLTPIRQLIKNHLATHNLEEIRQLVTDKVIQQHELPYVIQEMLGLWNRDISFHEHWNAKFGDLHLANLDPDHPYHELTFAQAQAEINADIEIMIQEHDNELKRYDQLKRSHLKRDLNLGMIGPTTQVVGLATEVIGTSPLSSRMVIDVSSRTIVTPRIINIIIDMYDSTMKAWIHETPLRPRDKFPEFKYTYSTPANGFTLQELIGKIRDSIQIYLYLASLIQPTLSPSLDTVTINGIEYREDNGNGNYFVHSYYHN